MKALFFKIVPYVTMLVAILAWAFGYVIYEETLIAWWEMVYAIYFTQALSVIS